MSPLTHGLNYRSACDEWTAFSVIQKLVCALFLTHRLEG